MLVAVIQDRTIDQMKQSIEKAEPLCDAFELRLDRLKTSSLEKISELRKTLKKPVIFTLRPKLQGGHYFDDQSKRSIMIKQLIQFEPNYFDLEFDFDDHFYTDLHQQYPGVKLIRSYHDFVETPENLDRLLDLMYHPSCSIIKIATLANSSIDALRMLEFVQKKSSAIDLAAHCMGQIGIPSRVLGPVVGSCLQYANVNGQPSVAPGCLTLSEYCDTYRYRDINRESDVYALLGDPVDKSTGHTFHNELFHSQSINAVYTKFKVNEDELADFFEYAKTLPFKGFSVTMPLKLSAPSFIKQFDGRCDQIGAINTIKVEKNDLHGTNTDGAGIFNALIGDTALANKSVLILGAGGAARAIAYEAKHRGVQKITIFNRTPSKAEQLATEIDGEGYDFTLNQAVLEQHDFVLNTLSSKIDTVEQVSEILTACIDDNTTYMDINYHSPIAALLEIAQQKAGNVVDGSTMFTEQALLQNQYWLRLS